ncbi:MAG: hypothetical protein ACQETL_07630 [Bacteroidota bacterium]
MKNLTLFSTLFLLLFYHSFGGFSQRKDLAVEIEQIDGYNHLFLNNMNTELLSKAVLIQIGDGNSAFVNQIGFNSVSAKQEGVLNSLNLIQSDFGGQFTLYQNGEMNNFKGELNGPNLEALVSQNGNFNTINQQVSGDHSLYELIQEGEHNTISQSSNRLGSTDLKIYQRGNKMQLIIKSN